MVAPTSSRALAIAAFVAAAIAPAIVMAEDAPTDELSPLRWIFALISAALGAIGWRFVKDAELPFTEPRATPNRAIPEELRRKVSDAIRLARETAGGPIGSCEDAQGMVRKLLGELVNPLQGSRVIGRGAARFDHQFVVLKTGHVIDPVARQVVSRRLISWPELRSRGLQGAVQEGIFMAKQWDELRLVETTSADDWIKRMPKIGKGLAAVGIVLAILNVATAPAGQHGLMASQEAGAWAGSFAVAWVCTKLGFSVFGAYGALVGALIGCILGALLGSAVAERLYRGGSRPPEVSQVSPVSLIDCKCRDIGGVGPLTLSYQEKCLGQEQAIREKAGAARTAEQIAAAIELEADENGLITLSGGYYCWPAGPRAWPAVGEPIAEPTDSSASGQ
jgi:hypothetical protein